MSKHSPGPWECDAGIIPPDGPERYADIYTDGGDLIIARFNDLIPEGRANGRLIAAAPELLEALKTLADEAWRNAGCMPDEAFHDAIAEARAAIAKAEGR